MNERKPLLDAAREALRALTIAERLHICAELEFEWLTSKKWFVGKWRFKADHVRGNNVFGKLSFDGGQTWRDWMADISDLTSDEEVTERERIRVKTIEQMKGLL